MTGYILITICIGDVTATWPMWGGDPSHVSVQLTRGNINGNPVIKWRAYPRYPSKPVEWQFATIADVDGDGKAEVLIGSEDSALYCLRGTDGGEKWRFRTGDWVYSSAAVADVDGDGRIEVVVGSWDCKVYCRKGTDGTEKWTYTTGGLVRSSPAIADLDGDGAMEIIVGSHDKKVYCLTGSGGKKWDFTTGGEVWSSPAVADVDGDGQLEVVVGSYDKYVYCISASGAQKWGRQTGGAVRSSPAIADLDRDGSLEVVIGSDDKNVYCLNGTDGTVKWTFLTGDWVQSSPSIADVDRDGKKEVLIGSMDCKLYCIGSNGNKKWEYMAPLPSYVHLPGALVDIDFDGYFEYLLSQMGGATLYCLNAESGTLAWQITLAVDIHSPFAGDIDGDGCSEIIVGTNSADGAGYRVFAIDDGNNTTGCGPLYEDVEEDDLGKGLEFRTMGSGIYLFMPKEAQVSLTVYDVQGRVVQRLYDGVLSQGGHTFNSKLEAKGIYIVILKYQGGMKSLRIVR
jgi:outer membrane protein assembly factor BamB